MKKHARKCLRALLILAARTLGARIRDARTGKILGRAILILWRGRIYAIGLNVVVQPVFLTSDRVTYWRQEIGFTTYEEPDFPNERGA